MYITRLNYILLLLCLLLLRAYRHQLQFKDVIQTVQKSSKIRNFTQKIQ